MKKILLFLVLLCVAYTASSQVYSIAQEPVCWTTPLGVDSSLNRYIMLSNLDNQPPRTLTYVNGAGTVVDVSGGGTMAPGYCGTIVASMLINEIDVVQDSIIILLAEGVEISRDTVGPFGGGGGADDLNGMFDLSNQDSSWQVTRYYLPTQHYGYIRQKGGFILQDSALGSRYAGENLIRIFASSGELNPPFVSMGSGNFIPEIRLEGDTSVGSGRVIIGQDGETYDMPIRDPDSYGLPPGEYFPTVTELGARGGTGGWTAKDSLMTADQESDQLNVYLAVDTLASPVVFNVTSPEVISVVSFVSVPTATPAEINIDPAPVGRYMFHLRNTDANTVDFPNNFFSATGELVDEGGQFQVFKDQMWDCYSDGTNYYCNSPTQTGVFDPFVFTVDTRNTSTGSTDTLTFKPPFTVGTSNDFTVNWGDGIDEVFTGDTLRHTYATAGIYNITIQGQIGEWAFVNTQDKLKILNILEWGDFRLAESAFHGCTNLEVDATDSPILSTNISSAFRACTSLSSLDVSTWNVSNTSDFSRFIQATPIVVLDVSDWNVSSATNFAQFAASCSSLTTLDVSAWNTQNVINLSDFVNGCSSLTTLDVSAWNTENVQILEAFVKSCSSLSTLDVSAWNTENVFNIDEMVRACTGISGNFDPSSWNITSLTSGTDFARGINLTTTIYDNILTGWEAQTVNNNVPVHFGTSQYTLGGTADAARAALVSDHSWTITDAGGI